MLLQCTDLLPDQRSGVVRANPDQPHPAIGKFQNLECAGIVDQLFDMLGNQLFRAQPHIDGRSFWPEQLGCIDVFGCPNSSNFGGGTEYRLCDLTSHHVDLIAACQRDD